MSTHSVAETPAIDPPASGSASAARKFDADLVLGARLAVGGGRASWTRLVLTALSVGMCVALLLIAASIGPASAARGDRSASMTPATLDQHGVAGPPMLEVHPSILRSGSITVTGMDVAILDPAATAPPGAPALPGPGELVLSPALATLLASPAGAGLRPRLAGPVVGTISDAGLVDPGDLRFYRGIAPSSGPLQADELAVGWGLRSAAEPLDAVTGFVLIAGTTILIVPLLLLVAMSTRLGGAARDRRLAAMRLVGASGGQIRRIAIGEALVAAAAGLMIGAGGFLLARAFARWIPVDGRTFFPSDLAPNPVLAVATGVLVPVLAVGAAMGALRSVIVEPLGVSRIGSGRPRRIGWRLLVVAAALGSILASSLLADQPNFGNRVAGFNATTVLVAAIALAMVSIPVLVPYLLEKVSKHLWPGGPGWQLAVRRLQIDSGTAGRVCSGIAVVLAGAVALLPLLGYAADRADQTAQASPPQIVEITDPPVAALTQVPELIDSAVPAAGPVFALANVALGAPANPKQASIVGCPSVLAITTAANCRDGDVFAVSGRDGLPTAGSMASLTVGSGPAIPWRMPRSLIDVSARAGIPAYFGALLITPGALLGASTTRSVQLSSIEVFANTGGGAAALDPVQQDAIRNSLAGYGWRVRELGRDGSYTSYSHLGQLLITIRMGLLVGGVLVLLVAALGLVVTAVEQITERRRALALAVAAGVPRAVLARSLLLGAVIPAVLAFVVADLVGLLIPLAVQPLLNLPLHTSPIALLLLTAAGLVLVVAVTALALPALRRLTRPEVLRTE